MVADAINNAEAVALNDATFFTVAQYLTPDEFKANDYRARMLTAERGPRPQVRKRRTQTEIDAIYGAVGKGGLPPPVGARLGGREAPAGWVMPGSRGGSRISFPGPLSSPGRVRPQGRHTGAPIAGEELINFHTTG